jgi:DNA (cytosine-5)-methyltransferase 1
MSQPAVFSFFAGAGFLDLGFEKTGFEICYVNESHKAFVTGYNHSRKVLELPQPKFGIENCSIENLDQASLMDSIRSLQNDQRTIGFIGGPPCPDFSVGGKNKGSKGDNGRLSQVYIDLICRHKPDFFLFENVKGLYRTKAHRVFFEALKTKLRVHGYTLHERLINAIEYGAPQDRDRIILLGFRDFSLNQSFKWLDRTYPERAAFDFEWPVRTKFTQDPRTPVPNNLPLDLTTQYWFDRNDVINHPNSMHCFQPRNGLKRFLEVDEGDDSRKSYKRLHRWRYSPTAAYGNNEVHLHPFLPRRISVSEALAIQSLPKEFSLPSTMTLTDMFKTIGNGVPYLAALGLARSIYTHLETSNAANCARHRQGYQSTAA